MADEATVERVVVVVELAVDPATADHDVVLQVGRAIRDRMAGLPAVVAVHLAIRESADAVLEVFSDGLPARWCSEHMEPYCPRHAEPEAGS